MLTRIDHVMICVGSLAHAVEVFTRIGFNVYPGGDHRGRGTHNAIAFNEEDYIELLGVRDRAEHERAAQASPGGPDAGLAEFLAKGGGFRFVIVQSDDLAGDVAAMRGRGVEVSDPLPGGRRTPGGQELSWRTAILGRSNPLPLIFIQHLTPLAERRHQVPRAASHPNGVKRLERAYVAVPDVAVAARSYSLVLGMPVPNVVRGNVIKADMAVFEIGPTGLGVAQPAEDGPAKEALARQGPGPFQALYRTAGLGAAVHWMSMHGMPAPARGVRNTGEQAMLVGPADACGAYIGFVGPE